MQHKVRSRICEISFAGRHSRHPRTLASGVPAPNTATTVEDVNKSSDSAFKIPITNPVTGALHVVQGGLDEGLKGLTDTAQSALEQAVQIPVIAKDGVVKVLPGGPDGLKAIQDNIDEAVKNAPKLPGVPKDGKLALPALGAILPTKAPTPIDDINKTSQSAFKIPITDPLSGAVHLVQGGLGEGLKGLTDTAQSALETATQIPVITKDGVVKTLPGGPEGLKAIKENFDEAVKNAPKLPGLPASDGKSIIPGVGLPSIPGLSGLPGVPGIPGIPGPSNGADPISLVRTSCAVFPSHTPLIYRPLNFHSNFFLTFVNRLEMDC